MTFTRMLLQRSRTNWWPWTVRMKMGCIRRWMTSFCCLSTTVMRREGRKSRSLTLRKRNTVPRLEGRSTAMFRCEQNWTKTLHFKGKAVIDILKVHCCHCCGDAPVMASCQFVGWHGLNSLWHGVYQCFMLFMFSHVRSTSAVGPTPSCPSLSERYRRALLAMTRGSCPWHLGKTSA